MASVRFQNSAAATFTDLPEEHQMLKDTCRQFAEAELWPIAGTYLSFQLLWKIPELKILRDKLIQTVYILISIF